MQFLKHTEYLRLVAIALLFLQSASAFLQQSIRLCIIVVLLLLFAFRGDDERNPFSFVACYYYAFAFVIKHSSQQKQITINNNVTAKNTLYAIFRTLHVAMYRFKASKLVKKSITDSCVLLPKFPDCRCFVEYQSIFPFNSNKYELDYCYHYHYGPYILYYTDWTTR